MTPPNSNPQADGLLAARTKEALHQASYDMARTRLSEKLGGEGAPPAHGACFLVLSPKKDLMFDGIIAPLIEGLGCEWTEVSAHLGTKGDRVRVILAGWMSQESYRDILAWVPGPHGWLSEAAFTGEEGPRVMLEKSGLILSDLVYWDPFDFLPGAPISGGREEALMLDLSFDYAADPVNPMDTSDLCYTRCVWGVSEGRGLVLERTPSSCWEAHHNALLQAAAPLMFQTLRAVVNSDLDAMVRVRAALAKILDPEWQAWVENSEPSEGGLGPIDILNQARGTHSASSPNRGES